MQEFILNSYGYILIISSDRYVVQTDGKIKCMLASLPSCNPFSQLGLPIADILPCVLEFLC